MSAYDPNNDGVRAERSLEKIAKGLQTESLFVLDGLIYSSRIDSTADYCSAECAPNHFLLMQRARWNGAFNKNVRDGAFGRCVTLKDVLVSEGEVVSDADYDADFRANNNAKFDIEINPSGAGTLGHLLTERLTLKTVECKCDGRCSGRKGGHATWNLFVEYEQRKDRASTKEIIEDDDWEPSALQLSKAAWYAFEWAYRCWAILPTKDLHTIADPIWAVRSNRKEGGDYDDQGEAGGRKCARGVLVPLKRLFAKPK